MDATLTVILSDVDGLYTANPRRDPTAMRIKVVEEVTPVIEALAQSTDSDVGVGGMATQIRAAKIVTSVGGMLVIVDGKRASLKAILRGDVDGTVFKPSRSPDGPPQALDRPRHQGDGHAGGRRGSGPRSDRARSQPAAGRYRRLRRQPSRTATPSW